MPNDDDPTTVATAYLEAMGRKDFPAFRALLAPDVTFTGPAATLSGVRDVAGAYERLAPVLIGTTLRKTFVDGDDVCLIYDFVTNTPAGAVPTVERLRVDGGQVRSIWLLTDHVRWPVVLEELRRRG